MANTIPSKMRALLVLHDGYSQSAEGPAIDSLEPYLEFTEIDVPQPGDGQVLIKVNLANINPSDMHFIKGEYGQPRRAGVPGGFEGVGEVVAAGQGGEVLMGKRVAFYVAPNGSGGWAEYATTDVTNCIILRDELRDEDGATLFVNPLTAIAIFDEVRNSNSKSFIMTAGASQLCKLIAALARVEGYQPISIVRRHEQVEMLMDHGNAHVLNTNDDDFTKRAAALFRQEKPRILLDAVGDNISAGLFDIMPNRSRWLVYGKLSTEAPTLEQLGQLIFTGKSIEGFWLVNWIRTTPMAEKVAAISRVQEMFISGVWKTDINAILPLASAFDELPASLAGMNTGKVMIKP